jgi:hypothetical protein
MHFISLIAMLPLYYSHHPIPAQCPIEKSERLRGLQPNDPEPLLAINNAKVLQQEPDRKKLVTIPIISSITNGYSTAVEVLRGAEIARMEIDRQGGIKGKKMLLLLKLASRVAKYSRFSATHQLQNFHPHRSSKKWSIEVQIV